jgi:hypothetical protein
LIVLRNIALCCSLLVLLACRSEPIPASVERSLPILLGDRGTVGRVVVVADSPPLSTAQQALLRRHHAALVLRQSALDWLDARGRFGSSGELSLHVQIRSVRLRGEFVALLFGRASRADHLEAFVMVARNGQQVRNFSARVASSVGGRDWKDPEERLQRMARMLGRRIAEGL